MEQDKPSVLSLLLGTTSVILLLAGMLGVLTLLPYLRVRTLTAAHAGEFESLENVAGENPAIRVLRYGKNSAKVSFLAGDGNLECVCTFRRKERAPEISASAAANTPNWIVVSRRIVRTTDDGGCSGILRSYLRMIGC